jgi:internalin A
LTKRSLYVLVADQRSEDTHFFYWLNIVELLSKQSLLYIIKNEKQNRKKEIDEAELRKNFISFRESFATNLANNRGLNRIVDRLRQTIQALPHVGDVLPASWKKVREILEQTYDEYISIHDYFQLCKKIGLKSEREMLHVLGYLHDLGVCLNF